MSSVSAIIKTAKLPMHSSETFWRAGSGGHSCHNKVLLTLKRKKNLHNNPSKPMVMSQRPYLKLK